MYTKGQVNRIILGMAGMILIAFLLGLWNPGNYTRMHGLGDTSSCEETTKWKTATMVHTTQEPPLPPLYESDKFFVSGNFFQ